MNEVYILFFSNPHSTILNVLSVHADNDKAMEALEEANIVAPMFSYEIRRFKLS